MSLAAARKNANLTQEQVAVIMNVARSTVRNWEKGVTYPKQPAIEKMCEIYGTSYDCIRFE
jgi:transcriptional regulator with XRE-family HTH domain